MVYLHVVLGEMIPKNIALAGPDRAALVLGPPIWAFVTVLRPVIVVINAVASGCLRLVGVRLMDEVSSTYTREEVAALVEESRGEGLLEEDEYDRLAGALGFTERTVAAVLMPPDTLTTVPRDATVADVEDVCAATGFSRFPVTDDDGACSATCTSRTCWSPTSPGAGARSSPAGSGRSRRCTPPTRCTTRWRPCSVAGAHLARVSDDEGALLGLVTLEDVIEELVGEIRDAAHLDE